MLNFIKDKFLFTSIARFNLQIIVVFFILPTFIYSHSTVVFIKSETLTSGLECLNIVSIDKTQTNNLDLSNINDAKVLSFYQPQKTLTDVVLKPTSLKKLCKSISVEKIKINQSNFINIKKIFSGFFAFQCNRLSVNQKIKQIASCFKNTMYFNSFECILSHEDIKTNNYYLQIFNYNSLFYYQCFGNLPPPHLAV